MPSDPPAAPTSASPPDTALVGRARHGDRRALAILYARHAPAVHARALRAGLSPTAAARVLRDVFSEAGRSLDGSGAADDPKAWLRGLTMDRLAGVRGPAPRLHPATTAAVAGAGASFTPAVRDAVWRELERAWSEDALPFWRRQPGALAAASLVGTLLVAVVVVGLLVREQIRPVTPAGATTLTAEPLEDRAVETEPPPPAPSVIVPPAPTEEPFVPPAEPEDDPTVAPSPEPEPTPSETGTDQPGPAPTGSESEQPSDDPSSTPPLLPLPGGGDGSEEPSDPPPSEGTGDGGDAGGTSDEGAGGTGDGDGTGAGTDL